MLKYRIDALCANGSVIREICFLEIFENANPQIVRLENLALYGTCIRECASGANIIMFNEKHQSANPRRNLADGILEYLD